MEHHAQSVDDALIGGLSYKLKAGASYVTNRRSVSFFASGGNQYSPSGVKSMPVQHHIRPLDGSFYIPCYASTEQQGLRF